MPFEGYYFTRDAKVFTCKSDLEMNQQAKVRGYYSGWKNLKCFDFLPTRRSLLDASLLLFRKEVESLWVH